MSVDPQRALDEYQRLTNRLEELYADQAQHKSAELTTYTQIWQGSMNVGITERNALAKQGSSHHTSELLSIEGDIQGTLAQLRYLDRLLEYGSDHLRMSRGP